ncbi:MAG TPA: efflux transporter periplasmic adaptor subunit, partial [Segetibacter sp.]
MKSTITLNALILLFGCSQPQTPAPVADAPAAEVITVATASAVTETDYTASLQGKVDVEIRPQVEGFL